MLFIQLLHSQVCVHWRWQLVLEPARSCKCRLFRQPSPCPVQITQAKGIYEGTIHVNSFNRAILIVFLVNDCFRSSLKKKDWFSLHAGVCHAGWFHSWWANKKATMESEGEQKIHLLCVSLLLFLIVHHVYLYHLWSIFSKYTMKYYHRTSIQWNTVCCCLLFQVHFCMIYHRASIQWILS